MEGIPVMDLMDIVHRGHDWQAHDETHIYCRTYSPKVGECILITIKSGPSGYVWIVNRHHDHRVLHWGVVTNLETAFLLVSEWREGE